MISKIVYCSSNDKVNNTLKQIHYLDRTLPKEEVKNKRPRIDRTIYKGQDYDLYKFEVNVKNKLSKATCK